MTTKQVISSDADYKFAATAPPHTNAYLQAPIIQLCQQLKAQKILDLGCGNGALCRGLHKQGFQVTGCDPSESGVRYGKEALPEGRFQVLGVYDDPAQLQDSNFDVVISTEVIEHLFYPRYLPKFANQVLRPGGHLILSTPYHGYLKNLALSLTNGWDKHFTPLWDGGHIKFWSPATLSKLLQEENFAVTNFVGTGRFPYLWKSMILVAQKQS